MMRAEDFPEAEIIMDTGMAGMALTTGMLLMKNGRIYRKQGLL